MYLAARLVTARSIFRGMTFMKKQAAMIAICAALLMSVAAAGCTSSTSPSPSAATTANASSHAATANSSSHAVTASATVSATPTATPTPTVSATPTVTTTPSPSGGTAGFTIVYIYEPGCPYCAAFQNTSSYAQLQQTGVMQSVPSTDTSTVQNYHVTAYPTVVLLKNGVQVGSNWVYPNIDTTAILAQINAG